MKAILETPAVQELLVELFVAIVALAIGSLPLVLRWFRAKGLEISAGEAAKLDKAARDAAAWAEEWARSMQKGTSVPPAGQDKLDAAVAAAKQLARDRLSAWTDHQIKLAIEAKLPELRAKTSSAPPPLDLPPEH